MEQEREALINHEPISSTAKETLYNRPKDRCHLVFFIFLYLGVATLLPWNFFITAKNYFDFKFRNTSLPEGVPYDVGNVTTEMQTNFESYLSISSMFSNLIFITIAMVFVRNISLNVRMMISLIPIMVIFVATVVLVKADTDSWQTGFFWFTLTTAALMVGLTAVMTGSLFGLSCLFPARYTQATMAGQALGGTLSAVVNILAIAGGKDPRSSAFGFFLTATACVLLAVFAYFSLYILKYSKFFMSNQDRGGAINQNPSINSEENNDVDNNIYKVNDEIPHSRELLSKSQYFSAILKKIWPYFTSVCLVFLVTLACFPAVVSLIRSVNYRSGDNWTDIYFSPVVCFLIYNLCDLIGRTSTRLIRIPRNGQKGAILTLSALRIAFIPLYMMCNIRPHDRKFIPVVLKHDAWPIVLNILLGLSNGYCGTLSMLYGPANVDLEQAEGAGMVMTFGMTLGLASGSILSLLVVYLI